MRSFCLYFCFVACIVQIFCFESQMAIMNYKCYALCSIQTTNPLNNILLFYFNGSIVIQTLLLVMRIFRLSFSYVWLLFAAPLSSFCIVLAAAVLCRFNESSLFNNNNNNEDFRPIRQSPGGSIGNIVWDMLFPY